MKICEQTEKLKELYSEHPYTYHLDSQILNILLYMLYEISIYPSTILFFDAFQISCRYQYPLPLDTSAHILFKVQYLFFLG